MLSWSQKLRKGEKKQTQKPLKTKFCKNTENLYLTQFLLMILVP